MPIFLCKGLHTKIVLEQAQLAMMMLSNVRLKAGKLAVRRRGLFQANLSESLSTRTASDCPLTAYILDSGSNHLLVVFSHLLRRLSGYSLSSFTRCCSQPEVLVGRLAGFCCAKSSACGTAIKFLFSSLLFSSSLSLSLPVH